MPFVDPQGRPPLVRTVVQGDDSADIAWRRSLSGRERLAYLRELRRRVINEKYGGRCEFRRVYRIVERERG